MRRNSYIDFAALKQRVSIQQVIEMLGLNESLQSDGDRLIGCCPIHKGSEADEFVVTPAKGLWFCHGACNAGGDMIELLARVRGASVVQAAREIADRFTEDSGDQGDEEVIETPLGQLRPRHAVVQGFGIRPETAKAFSAGYCTERESLVIPIFDDRGKLLSHVSLQPRGKEVCPDDFAGRDRFFNVHRVFPAECLYVTQAVLNVLRAHQEGIVNAISIFGAYDPDRLFSIAAFVRRRGIGRVEFF